MKMKTNNKKNNSLILGLKKKGNLNEVKWKFKG